MIQATKMQETGNNQIQNKSLSIRICAGGLSFCVYTPTDKSPYKYVEYRIKPTISLAANLKEALQNEDILKAPYKRVNILITNMHFTVVPTMAFNSDNIEDIYKYNFPKDKANHVSFNVLRRSGIAIIFGFDKNVYQLLLDDFPNARFYASASTLIEYLSEKSLSGKGKKMFAYVHENEMTLFCFNQGRMVFINSFESKNTEDNQYYILNVWKNLGMDQLEDKLCIVGDCDNRYELADKMSMFVKDVTLMDRENDYKYTKAMKTAMIPYDLQTLLVCGL